MTGTFIIRPAIQTLGGSPFKLSDGTPNNRADWENVTYPVNTILQSMQGVTDLYGLRAIAKYNQLPVQDVHFNDTLRFAFFDKCIYLDGSLVPIAFTELPAGFTPLTASVQIDPSIFTSNIGNGTSSYFLQKDQFSESLANVNLFVENN